MTFELPEGEGHHVRKVLRGRPGDTFEAVDSERRLFEARLNEGPGALVLSEDPTFGDLADIRLYQAVPKGKHMDLLVEKATELGVTSITPLVTEHGVVKLGEERNKVDRWLRVAEAAARQSLQLRVPDIREPVSFPDALQEVGEDGVILHNGEGLSALEERVSHVSVGLLIGPEGGWSEGELSLAAECGVPLAQLGSYRLRSETAGMVAVARTRATIERAMEKSERG
ncbi:MAG: 16S rRNA (uracil(1498)-N(3))-methyltransferase, partial [Actinomycetota bacterium]|nr:16S rRNA (uracil(1498)-N(3))-methyltransferase [Actinomycetota bacterium]